MHVLIVSPPLSGLQANVLSFALYLRNKQHDVTVICNKGEFEKKLKYSMIRTVITDYSSEASDALINEIIGINMRSRVHIIHAYPFDSRKLALQIASHIQSPVGLCIHDQSIDDIGHYIKEIEYVFMESDSSNESILHKIPDGERNKLIIAHSERSRFIPDKIKRYIYGRHTNRKITQQYNNLSFGDIDINSGRKLDGEVGRDKQDELDIIDVNKVLTLTKINEQTVEIANQILDNKFYLLSSLDVVKFEDAIDWKYLHGNSNNTYQLYIHSLIVLSYLCDAYRETTNNDYLIKANDIVESWIKYNNSNDAKSRLVWSDHATADRLINLVYLLCVSKGRIIINHNNYRTLIESHCYFLYSESNYSKNNHGIMMDRALYLASHILKSHPKSLVWRNKAIHRLREAYYRDFSSKGTHLENSPEYHGMVLRLFKSTQNMLNNFGDTLGDEILKKMKLSDDYYQFITKPNQYLPMIGDSGEHKVNIKKSYENYLDTEAGIAILQQENLNSPEKSNWCSFICGFGSTTHKHYDDLSITINFKGEDIFIDSGKYNYDLNDPLRKYIISPYAHTTVFPEGREYSLNEANKVKITDYSSNDCYDMVRGENNAYSDISIARSLFYLKPDIFLIIDHVKSVELIKVHQVYNLAPDVNIKTCSDNLINLQVDNMTFQIKQLLSVDNLEIINGDVNGPRGMISRSFRKTSPTKQLQFSKSGKEFMIVTEVKFGEEIGWEVELNLEKNILSLVNKNREFLVPIK